MEKQTLSVQGCNILFSVLSSILCSSIGTQLGVKHPPGTEICIKTFERLTICVRGRERCGRAFPKKIQRHLGARVSAFSLMW